VRTACEGSPTLTTSPLPPTNPSPLPLSQPPQDIKSRAAHKQQVLDEADGARRFSNSLRRVDRDLFNSLRRDKVGGWVCGCRGLTSGLGMGVNAFESCCLIIRGPLC
jgi:hypothetical protein